MSVWYGGKLMIAVYTPQMHRIAVAHKTNRPSRNRYTLKLMVAVYTPQRQHLDVEQKSTNPARTGSANPKDGPLKWGKCGVVGFCCWQI